MEEKSTKKILETVNLRKSFSVGDQTVEILKGINVDVDNGEFLIIFGPSGCGKSTLLHCLLGLEAPTSGEVLLEGSDMYKMSEDERALYRRHHVGTIYQQPLWIGSLTVLENIVFPLKLMDINEAKIKERSDYVLSLVGMEKWANYRPTELSSGQQQKISLARSLMVEPKLVVADEPTGNLDTVSGRELLDTFIKLVDTGKSIVMVTHDLEYLRFATKVYHVVDGQIVGVASPDKKKRNESLQIGKKEIESDMGKSNVRDVDFLKKLGL